MLSIISEHLVGIIIGEGTSVLVRLGRMVKKKYQIKYFVKSIQKQFKKVIKLKVLNFDEYLENFLGMDGLIDKSEEEFEDIVKEKFQEKLNSNILQEYQNKISISLKERNLEFVTLHLLKEVYTQDFFYQIFGYPGIKQDHKKLIDLIRRLFFEEYLKIIDTEKLGRELYWDIHNLDEKFEDLHDHIDKLRSLSENVSTTIKNVYEDSLVEEKISKILKKIGAEITDENVKVLSNYLISRDIDSIINNQTTSKFSEEQYEQYKEIWDRFLKLKNSADRLWTESFNYYDLRKFEKWLSQTKSYLMEKSIFIEAKHYRRLNKLLNIFKLYYDGKNKVYSLGMKDENGLKKEAIKMMKRAGIKESKSRLYTSRIPRIKEIIRKNKEFLDQYTSLLDEIKKNFQQKLQSL